MPYGEQGSLASISSLSQAVIGALKSAKPQEVAVSFGVELGGELGIPLVTKGSAKANFNITLKWKAKGAGSDD